MGQNLKQSRWRVAVTESPLYLEDADAVGVVVGHRAEVLREPERILLEVELEELVDVAKRTRAYGNPKTRIIIIVTARRRELTERSWSASRAASGLRKRKRITRWTTFGHHSAAAYTLRSATQR